MISELNYSGLVLLGMSSCYLSYWVIRSWVFYVYVFPPPWWNNYALKFRIIRTAQSGTFSPTQIPSNILQINYLVMTVFCSVGCSQYVGHWKHHLWWYYRSQEQARPGCGNSLVCCPHSDKIFCSQTFGWRYSHSLMDNCSCTNIKSHSVGSILKLDIFLPITD